MLLIASVPITFWDYSFCNTLAGKHTIIIRDDVISENTIQICNDAKDKRWVLAHELGHQYWHLGLSLWERDEYRKLFAESQENDFYRDYSKTNVIEDFADVFWVIVTKKSLERGDVFQKKIDFIKKTFK